MRTKELYNEKEVSHAVLSRVEAVLIRCEDGQNL